MEFLISLAVMLIIARIFGEITKRMNLPALIGYILAGVIMGPILGIIPIAHIEGFGMIGLTLLVFIAGFTEVETERLLKDKMPIILCGVLNSVIPFGIGYFVSTYFGLSMITSLFVGTVLAATSISISVGALIDVDKLASRVGRVILGAGVVDDIVGLFMLAIVSSIAVIGALPTLWQFAEIIAGIGIFFLIFFAAWFAIPKLLERIKQFKTKEMRFSIVLVIILIMAFAAENLGLSTVLGAFLAGLVLSRASSLETKDFYNDLEVVSYGVFIPLFFALIGLKMILAVEALSIFTLVLITVAVASKFFGGIFSCKLSHLTNTESVAIGFATIPRGEVAFVVLLVGQSLGVIPEFLFSSTFIMVLTTIIITPILLKLYLKNRELPD